MILTDNFEIQPLILSNFPANGSLGTAVNTVDKYHTFYIPQTTANVALTIPSPTVTANSKKIAIVNSGIVPITVGSKVIGINQFTFYFWNGTIWSPVALVPTTAPNVVTFTANGVYTPSVNMKAILVEVVGGGGGGGGTAVAGASIPAASGGGQAGGYAAVFMTRAQVIAAGGFPTVTIGSAGTGGAAVNGAGGNGGNGGNSSFLGVITCNGGTGGHGGIITPSTTTNAQGTFYANAGGIVTVLSGTTILTVNGHSGSPGSLGAPTGAKTAMRIVFGGDGGKTPLSQQHEQGVSFPSAGSAGITNLIQSNGFGTGGGGVGNSVSAQNVVGVPGKAGLVIITEYS